MVNRFLSRVLFFGFLFNSLPGWGDEGDQALYWSCVNGSCEPTTKPGIDPGRDSSLLLGYIKKSAEPGTMPLYWTCISLIHCGGCARRVLMAQPRYDGSLLLGYIPVEQQPGTVPLYWSCRQRDSVGECVDLAPDNRGGFDSALLGHVYTDGLLGQY